MKIGKKEFILGEKTYVMGILNVTPDSFSDGGKFNQVDTALKQARKIIDEGADIIDIGGESTRPGGELVDADEELRRVIPVIEALSKELDIVISIDTYKSEVAEAAVKAGATLINDVWGFKKDKNMAVVAAKYDVACCLMHNRESNVYDDFIEDMKKDLTESINIALNAGVKKDKIILDPGVGFAKNYIQNLVAINRVDELKVLGYPLLLATSRKSVIGTTLDLPIDERVEGTVATTTIGVMKGCDFVRVHDIKENVRAAKMTNAIIRESKWIR